MKHYLDAAENAARAAGKLLRENFQQRQRVKAVAAHDIKLEIDVRAQELIGKLLLDEFPAHALYGEEGIVGDQSSDHQWIVDPLDGTVNYFYGIPHFCISIALRLHQEIVVGVIHDPIRSEMWTGQRGDVSKLNGAPIHVSDRAELAEAVISIGLAKTGETINTNFPLLQQMIHRVRKCRADLVPEFVLVLKIIGSHFECFSEFAARFARLDHAQEEIRKYVLVLFERGFKRNTVLNVFRHLLEYGLE
jgi:myo-inositol-1(or 4)-monophosphatase